MPRTALTPITVKGPYPGTVAADALDFTLTAADVANGNDVVASGNDLLIIQNSGASTYTATIASVSDEKGRTGDITAYSLAAGDFAVFYFGNGNGWQQTTGKYNLDASNAAVKFALLKLGRP
jgi:hypothetical protein